MISVYTQFYNVKKYNIDYKSALKNFEQIADEVVVAVNTTKGDRTYASIKKWAQNHSKIKVVECKYKYDDIEFDGKVKDFALKNTTLPIKVQMDGDERFDLNRPEMFHTLANHMMFHSDINGIMTPSIDLWGDLKKVRKNHRAGFKFRIHKAGINRGVPNFAKFPNGKIDTTKSDTTEPIDENGNLIQFHPTCAPDSLEPTNLKNLSYYTFHLGYVNFEYRKKISEFWAPHWNLRSGTQTEKPATDESLSEDLIEHGINFKI